MEGTIIIIDEIQESPTVYNLIREFTRNFHCRFIVTGSYLGRTLNTEFRLSAGDLKSLRIETLYFEGFTEAFGLHDAYEGMGLYGTQHPEDLAKLSELFRLYSEIGVSSSDMQGRLHENFVFLELRRRGGRLKEIVLETPAFATYRGGEIDFLVKSLLGKENLYALEVKSGKNTAPTGQKALEDGKVDYLLLLKGNTQGGQAGNVFTIPVFLFQKFEFTL